MKRFPVWLGVIFISFALGVGAVILWTYPFFIGDIKAPSRICLSEKFPGKSVSIDDLKPHDRSPFIITENAEVSYADKRVRNFYTSFEEEFFDKAKFYDGKVFPEIAMADEIYRFFWLRTFHNPIVIRVYKIGGEKFIVAKQTDGRGGYDYGKLIFNQSRKLSHSEWCEFIELLDKADFWNKKKIDIGKLAHDGAMWEIEGVRERHYYISGEQSPETGEFRDACIYLMRISGLKIDENARDFY